MEILKFGGASVKSADAVRNMAAIVSSINAKHIIIVSAMDKTTNALESLCDAYFYEKGDKNALLDHIVSFHMNIINELFEPKDSIFSIFKKYSDDLRKKISDNASLNYYYEYDKIVSYGEILSTLIISEFLNKKGHKNKWIDVRNAIKTDDTFKEGKVNWELSERLANIEFSFEDTNSYVSQGFIAGTTSNLTTTLGREGSDYTAAILANLLNAEKVSIWKDVPGIMNADPKEYPDAKIIKQLSYKETIELAYFGAKVIHPNTIKPLENKNIPLYVKSFINPKEEGSIVSVHKEKLSLIPIYVHKREQSLVSLTPKDFSFIEEIELAEIFTLFIKHGIKTNLVQSSAISFSFCCNYKEGILDSLFNDLKDDYFILYNEKTELITLRYFDEQSVERATNNKNILLEQRTRLTARFVVEDKQ